MVSVSLLGGLRVDRDGRDVALPASRKARLLLALLAVERRPHGRSELAGRLWPDVLEGSARVSLRTALVQLRSALGDGAAEAMLVAGRDEVGLAAHVGTDLGDVEALLEAGRGEAALERCRLELLAGFDDDWVHERRDALRDRIAQALAAEAAAAEAAGDLAASVRVTRLQASLDPLSEEPHRELIRRLAAAGDVGAAVAVFERLRERLADQLRIVPSAATRAVLEGIRTQPPTGTVTLLFTDLVGSTELLERIGEDAVHDLRREHFAILRDVVLAHGGHEVKSLGDGLMVAFPGAREALACAVGIQQAVERRNRRAAQRRLAVRVGLNAGEPLLEEDDYFSRPVVVARRICDRAGPGRIFAADLVRTLAGSAEELAFEPLGPLELKGLAEPVVAWEVRWRPAGHARIRLPAVLPAGPRSPLVGRAGPLAELHAEWERARTGERRVAAISGEPGIGKTRLAGEFCREAHGQGALVMLGRCYEEGLVPYGPLVEALDRYAGGCDSDELRLAAGAHADVLAALLPEVAQRLGASSSEETGKSHRFASAAAALVREAAAERPVILMLDDLHWLDTTTARMLRHVLRGTEGASLLVLLPYRGTEVDETHPLTRVLAEARRGRWLAEVDLAGLDAAAVASLVTAEGAPAALAQAVHARTDGNPFFVEELAREARSRSIASADELVTPQSVKDLLLRRLQRLDEISAGVLDAAAVIGVECTLEQLRHAGGLEPDDLVEALDRACAAHTLRPRAEPGHYVFAHALVREVVYERLSAGRRGQLHRRVGEALQSLGADAAVIAHHFAAAGDPSRALEHHVRAGDAAARVEALEAAIGHYAAALEAAQALGREPGSDPELAAIGFQHGRALFRAERLFEARAALEDVVAVARTTGDRSLEMHALAELGYVWRSLDLRRAPAVLEASLRIAERLGDVPAQVGALHRSALVHCDQLRLDRAAEDGQRALQLARRHGGDDDVALGLDALKLVAWQLGDIERLAEVTRELEGLQRRHTALWYLAFTLLESAQVPIAALEWDDAEARLDEALEIGERIGAPTAVALALDSIAVVHEGRGQPGAAASACDRALALVERGGSVSFVGWIQATAGQTLLRLRDGPRAVQRLRHGLEMAERAGSGLERVRCTGLLARALWLCDDRAEALAMAERAEAQCAAISTPPGMAALYAAAGYSAAAHVLADAGAPERGERMVAGALASAQGAQRAWFAVPIALAAARCAEAQGQIVPAERMLAAAAPDRIAAAFPPAWEALAALARLRGLAGRADDAARTRAAAAQAVDEIAASLRDPAQGEAFRTAAGNEIAGEDPIDIHTVRM